MSEDQANEVIHLRHRLRLMAGQGNLEADSDQILARFGDLSLELGIPDLVFEHARWCAQIGHMSRAGAPVAKA
jgi:hypothetical protein